MELIVPVFTAALGWFVRVLQERKDGPRLGFDRKQGRLVNVGNGSALNLVFVDPSRSITGWSQIDAPTTLAPGETLEVPSDAVGIGNGVYVIYSSGSGWTFRLMRTPRYDDPWSFGRWVSFLWSGIRPWRRGQVFYVAPGRRFMQRFTENGLEGRTRQSYRRIQPIWRMYEPHHNPLGGRPLSYDELLEQRNEKEDTA